MFFFSYFEPQNNLLKQSSLHNIKIIPTPLFIIKTTNLWDVICSDKKALINKVYDIPF